MTRSLIVEVQVLIFSYFWSQHFVCNGTFYLLTYLLTYLLPGAESFLRS